MRSGERGKDTKGGGGADESQRQKAGEYKATKTQLTPILVRKKNLLRVVKAQTGNSME